MLIIQLIYFLEWWCMIFSGGSVVICVCLSGCRHHGRAAVADKSFYLFYSFNCFHHDHNAKIRLGRRDTLEEVTRMRAKGMGHNRAGLQIKCALKKKTHILHVRLYINCSCM